jgi:hypothetical protein
VVSSIPTNVSKSVRDLNPHIYGVQPPARTVNQKTGRITFIEKKQLRLVITGQTRGGKNSMGVTRTGRHYPKKDWAAWRDAAVMQIQAQLPPGFQTITEPVNARLEYVASNHRRHDQPAILDAIFHVLERAEIVRDDCLIWVTNSTRSYDKANPRAVLTFDLP